jgi:anhydro-N-acetylmuramic acid kinase
MAAGGQGAPLVPAFHQHVLLTQETNRVVVNIGGIANITLLPTNKPVLGYDTGPGNNLMDAWANLHWQMPCDKNGEIARKGQVDSALLKNLLADAFFKLDPPKSTGSEYFNLTWLKKYLPEKISREDVQATLTEFTAQSIMFEIKKHFKTADIIVCGGGIHNQYLMQSLEKVASPMKVFSSQDFGIDPDWMEAMAFAWLAKQTLSQKPGNLMSVTGAKKAVVLGGVYSCY